MCNCASSCRTIEFLPSSVLQNSARWGLICPSPLPSRPADSRAPLQAHSMTQQTPGQTTAYSQDLQSPPNPCRHLAATAGSPVLPGWPQLHANAARQGWGLTGDALVQMSCAAILAMQLCSQALIGFELNLWQLNSAEGTPSASSIMSASTKVPCKVLLSNTRCQAS